MSDYGKFFSWRDAVLKSKLQPTTRHVLLTLSCHMNDAGESCFPTISTLCSETGLSKQTIITHLDLARDAGWVVIGKHGFKGQRWANNDYKISWPHMEDGQGDLPPSNKGGQTDTTKVVNLAAEGGQLGITKVVKEVDSSTPSNTPTVLQVTHQPNADQEPLALELLPEKLPGNLTRETWDDFKAARKSMKAKMTDRAEKLLLRELTDLVSHGEDAEKVVEQSIMKAWRGLFPVKANEEKQREWKPGRPIYINGVRVPDHQCDTETGWVSPEFGRSP
jgi:hypothetical protein